MAFVDAAGGVVALFMSLLGAVVAVPDGIVVVVAVVAVVEVTSSANATVVAIIAPNKLIAKNFVFI